MGDAAEAQRNAAAFMDKLASVARSDQDSPGCRLVSASKLTLVLGLLARLKGGGWRARHVAPANVHRAPGLLNAGNRDSFLAFTDDAVERFPDNSELRLVHAIALLPFRPEDARWETAPTVKLNADDPGF